MLKSSLLRMHGVLGMAVYPSLPALKSEKGVPLQSTYGSRRSTQRLPGLFLGYRLKQCLRKANFKQTDTCIVFTFKKYFSCKH